MDIRIGSAEFDAKASVVSVGWAEFDARSTGQVCVGWAEFDCIANHTSICVGWAELDCRSPTSDDIPPYRPGGGLSRYHSRADKKYDIPVDAREDEEEQIIMKILMEIAADVLR